MFEGEWQRAGDIRAKCFGVGQDEAVVRCGRRGDEAHGMGAGTAAEQFAGARVAEPCHTGEARQVRWVDGDDEHIAVVAGLGDPPLTVRSGGLAQRIGR